jgi:hypothetical protein
MNWRTLAGTAAVTAVSLAVLGIVANFFLENELLLSSEMQLAALLSLGLVAVALAAFAAIGNPWQGWDRTPYW